LAVKVVAQFIISRVGDAISSDYSKIHGTAVWALSASPKSEVQYHIDYAELVRYETNIIYPPIYAGTLHCSNMGDGEIVGGKFEANLEVSPRLASSNQFATKLTFHFRVCHTTRKLATRGKSCPRIRRNF